MANIAGYVPNPENPEWGAFKFEDGTQSTWFMDPGGKVRAETNDIVAKIAGVPPAQPIPGPTPAMREMGGPSSGFMPQIDGAPPPATAPLSQAEKERLAPTPSQMTALEQPTATVPSVPTAPAGTTAPPRGTGGLVPGQAPAAPAPNTKGLVRSGANLGSSVGTTGLAEADRIKVEEASRAAQESQRAADEAAAEAKTQQVNAEWTRLTAEEKTKLAETAALEEKQKIFDGKIAEHTKELKAISERPIDGSKAFAGDAGWYAMMAGFGDSLQNFGAALAGRSGNANPGATIERILQRSLDQQTQQKEIDYKNGLITKDQLDAERGYVRLNLAAAYEQLAKTRLSRAKTEEERLALPAMAAHASALRDKAATDTALALATHETTQQTMAEQFDKPKPIAAGVTNATKEALALLGVTAEDYDKGMNSKIGSAEGAPTYNQAVQSLAEINSDVEALNSLAAANGGTIPQKGLLRIPEALIPTMARMGINSGMEAEEVGQLIQEYTMKRARSYGASITTSDIESAQKETGTSGEALRRFMTRQYNQTNNAIRQGLDTKFVGVGQQVLDLSRRRFQQVPGVPLPEGVEPMEVQNIEHTEAARAPKSDVEIKQEANRARAGATISNVLKPIGGAMAKPPSAYRSKM